VVPGFPRLLFGCVDFFRCGALNDILLFCVFRGAHQLDRPSGSWRDQSVKGNALTIGKRKFGKVDRDGPSWREIAVQDSKNTLLVREGFDLGNVSGDIGTGRDYEPVEG